jgi:uncharacterized DUF497 family protein
MEFEFNAQKEELNRRRHGIDFLEAQELWAHPHAVIAARSVGGEKREMIIGALAGRVYAAIFTLRAGRIRLISCHRADVRLERIYEKNVVEERPH